MKKILIINPFGIGDVIFSTPLIEILKKAYPDSYIAFVCNRRAFGVLQGNPHLSRIFIYEKDEYRQIWQRSKSDCIRKAWSFLREIKGENFDIAIDLSLGYQFSMCLKFIGVKRRIGFNYRNRGRFLTDKADFVGFNDKHVIEYYLDLLSFLGIDIHTFAVEPKIYMRDENKIWADQFLSVHKIKKDDIVVGLIPGCGASWGQDAYYRRWSPWKFAKIADYIVKRYGGRILILGEAKEHPICAEVQSEMEAQSISLCGKTTLTQCAALIERCDMVITNDGGPLHMAVALKRKTISVFGPVDERIYGPYPPGSDYVTVTSNEGCRPCYIGFKHKECAFLNCLKAVRPEDMLPHIDRLMESRNEAGAGIPRNC